jgi:hypothetical protein
VVACRGRRNYAVENWGAAMVDENLNRVIMDL